MKKLLVVLVSLLAFAAVASAQSRAIGARIGYGAELSYQHSLGSNFLEADLGFLGSAHGLYITGIYDFIFAKAGSLNFYGGPAAQIGLYTYSTVRSFNAGVGAQLGAEFELPSLPLNISLDWRPIYYLRYGGFGWDGIALGIRYRF